MARKSNPNLMVPPWSGEAEQAVLGSILMRSQVLDEVTAILRGPEEFYRTAHGLIYQAILDLYAKGEMVEQVAVSELLRERGQLKEVGGAVFLADLSEHVGTAVNAPYYARMVHEKAVLRSLLAGAQEIVADCLDRVEDLGEFLSRVEEKIFAITNLGQAKGGPLVLQEIIGPVVEKLEELHEKRADLTGLPTGYIDIDRITGGLQDEDLIILAGRPGQGKSALGLNICSSLSAQGIPSLYFSLEMSKSQQVHRLLASQGRLDTLRLRDGKLTAQEWVTLYAVKEQLEDAPLYIDDAPALTPLEIRSRARRCVSRYGVRLILVDYLQRVQSKGRTRNEEVGQAAQVFKNLARELRLPVLVMSQLSRECESRDNKRPLMRDLRESGQIEQEADVVAFLYRDEYYYPEKTDQKGMAELIIRKHRNGPLGTVELAFDEASVTFRNLAKN